MKPKKELAIGSERQKKMSKIGETLTAYLADRLGGALLFLAEGAVIWLVLWLGEAAIDIRDYILLLHFVLWGLAFCFDFSSYCRQYRYLQKLRDKKGELDRQENRIGLGDKKLFQLCDEILEEQNHLLRQREEEEKNRLKSYQEYYTLWVHQIKTPIFALELLLRGVGESGLSSQMNAELLKIKDYTQLALQYIRLEDMAADLDLKTYALENIVKNQLKKYALLFINQKVRLELAEFQLDVITDEKWLAFVLGQILTNALKYTAPGGQIRIRLEDRTLIIADTGLGIRAEDIPRLFTKGFTGDNGRRQKEASGMGLYLSAKVMQTLGHAIWLESEQGKGTQVFLNFPEQSLQEY